MTRKTFYNKLRKVAHKFKWELRKGAWGHDGITTLVARSTLSHCGETFLSEHEYCPVTAVCFGLGLGKYNRDSYDNAAKMMGLDFDEAGRIVVAADNTIEDYDFNPRIRKTILKAVGL